MAKIKLVTLIFFLIALTQVTKAEDNQDDSDAGQTEVNKAGNADVARDEAESTIEPVNATTVDPKIDLAENLGKYDIETARKNDEPDEPVNATTVDPKIDLAENLGKYDIDIARENNEPANATTVEDLGKDELDTAPENEIDDIGTDMDIYADVGESQIDTPLARSEKHIQHVKAHDGFHSLRKERYWAHWNDAFTKTTNSPISN